MLIKTSKKMAAYLDNKCKDEGWEISHIKVNNYQYNLQIGYEYSDYADLDYDNKTGLYNLILLEYQPEDYAYPAFINTKMLNDIFKKSDHTEDGFVKRFIDEYSI